MSYGGGYGGGRGGGGGGYSNGYDKYGGSGGGRDYGGGYGYVFCPLLPTFQASLRMGPLHSMGARLLYPLGSYLSLRNMHHEISSSSDC